MSSGSQKGQPPAGKSRSLSTRLSHTARNRELTQGGVNPVIQRASTVIVSHASKLFEPGEWTYGRHGTATHRALKQALCEIEGSARCVLVPSGLMACTIPLLTFARPGGHVLAVDTVYGPTRRFLDRMLTRFGVQVTYFPPDIGDGITTLIRPETQVMFVESPGSMTFEVADAPALAKAARAAGVIAVMDNTWSAGVFHKPLSFGFDISVQANTKYVSGGADVLNGAMHTDDNSIADQLDACTGDIGSNVSADDAFTVLRGARSLALRMQHHQTAAIAVATWLSDHPHVARVLHPALPEASDHALWRRDFTGSSGLFSFVLKPADTPTVHAFLDALDLFGLGFSYGGFESLAIHCNPQLKRSTRAAAVEGPLIRLSVGLEDPADLINDLDQALGRLD